MPDFNEAVGQDVEEKSPDELLWRNGNGPFLFGVKSDVVFIEANHPLVGYGYAVCAPAEVLKNIFRSLEGFFGAGHPVLPV